MATTFENTEAAFATTMTRGPMPRWQRKALEETNGEGCRFIPDRAGMNMDACHFSLTAKDVDEELQAMTCSPSKLEYQRSIKSSLTSASGSDAKILAFKQQAPKPKEGFQAEGNVVFTQNKTGSFKGKKAARHIAQTPDRILDAPELKSDFYLNLIDWSSSNAIAVALGGAMYLWNAGTGSISELFALESPTEYVSSVSWAANGSYLAVGVSDATVQIWDVTAGKRVRTMQGHSGRVAAMAWNEHMLSSGDRSGAIFQNDVRVQQHVVATLGGHTQEVCGLKWSCDGKYLASGANDNIVNVWNQAGENTQRLTQHTAAVKALAWCPWQANLLATGGGTADRTMRFWNANTGACINTVDTMSQVSGLLWSAEHQEIVSSHGFAQNQLTLWKYPSLQKTTELLGHTDRVLGMAMSPDGSTVVSASSDETLRFWRCFASDGKAGKKKASDVATPATRLSAMIR